MIFKKCFDLKPDVPVTYQLSDAVLDYPTDVDSSPRIYIRMSAYSRLVRELSEVRRYAGYSVPVSGLLRFSINNRLFDIQCLISEDDLVVLSHDVLIMHPRAFQDYKISALCERILLANEGS